MSRLAAMVLFTVLFSAAACAETIKETPSTVTPPADFVESAAPKEPAKAAAAVEAPASSVKDQELLLELIINDAQMEDVVEALQRNGKLFLPIGQLSEILDFSIKVDPATKSATGWFIREQNTLTLSERSGEVKGRSVTIPAGGVFADDKDLYVDSDLLGEWMPLAFAVDLHRMTLRITTREALPFQAKNKRDKLHQTLAQQGQAVKDKTFKKIDISYAAAQWPTVDLTVSPSYDSTNKGLRTDYSALAVGDFGYLTSRLYLAGNLPNNDLSNLRLSFGRDDYEKNLLGFAHASSFRFGDIDSASLAQVSTPTQGRGFTLTNRALDRPDNFDVTNFIGDSKPGWEVELYRNGTLIDFQMVGPDGRYDFKAVPVLFGNNQFRLAFYGPQGQVQEITKTINAASSLLERGELSYNFSADEKNKSLFGISDQNSPSTPTGLSSVGEMEYGVSRGLTIAVGGAHTALIRGNHNYATAGLRSSVGNILASADTAYDRTDKTYSTRLSLSTDLRNTLLSFQQKFANNFFSEENSTLTNPINRQSVGRVDRQFGDLGASLSYTRNQFEGGRLENLWTNQISGPLFGGMTFTNTLHYDHDSLGLDQLGGSAFLRGYFNHLLLGAQVDYEDRPLRQVDTIKLDALYPFSNAFNDKITLTSQVSGIKTNTLENAATFDMSRYKLSVAGRATDKGDYFAGLTFNMSIGRLPESGKWLLSGKTQAETGTVVVIPYIDHNYNQIRDAGEQAPPGSSIRIGSQPVKVDRNGTAIAAGLTTNVPLNITIDPDNQQGNPLWSTGVEIYKVVPRAGKIIALPFPVFETSQVEGTVSVPPGISPQGLAVELVDTDGQVIRTAHSAFDGYFLLEGVMPGAYKIRIAADSLAARKLSQVDLPSLIITVSDFFVKDIHLVDQNAPAALQSGSAPQPRETVSADGPPMPQVKPEEVPNEPLPDDVADFARSAQPVAPAPVAQAAQAVRKSLVIINDLKAY